MSKSTHYRTAAFCMLLLCGTPRIALSQGAIHGRSHTVPITASTHGPQHDSSYSIGETGDLPGMANLHDPHFEVIFDRQLIDFQTQGIGQENCENVALTNRSEHTRMLTKLISKDPKHFRINAPVPEMMPMTLAPNQSIQINICFKADREREFKSMLVATLDTDKSTVTLLGRGVKPKPFQPIPTVLAIRAIPSKRRSEKTLALDIPTRSSVTLNIDDILGKTPRHLLSNELKSAGVYEVNFNWRDDNEKPLPAGTYYARLQVQGIETHKVETVTADLELKP